MLFIKVNVYVTKLMNNEEVILDLCVGYSPFSILATTILLYIQELTKIQNSRIQHTCIKMRRFLFAQNNVFILLIGVLV